MPVNSISAFVVPAEIGTWRGVRASSDVVREFRALFEDDVPRSVLDSRRDLICITGGYKLQCKQ